MTSSSNTRGYPKLYGNRDVDRLQWFVRKKLELNTKSPSLFCALQELIFSAASAARSGCSTWGRGRPKVWTLRAGTGGLGTHFFTQNSRIIFFGRLMRGMRIERANRKSESNQRRCVRKNVAKFRRGSGFLNDGAEQERKRND